MRRRQTDIPSVVTINRVYTPEHRALVTSLEASALDAWGPRALLSCLRHLGDEAGLGQKVSVQDAWAFDDGYCLIYQSPWGPPVGVRVTSSSTEGRPPFWYQHWLTSDAGFGPTPEEAGREFADLAIGEPLGSIVDSLVYDRHGLGWWGEAPLPPIRPTN